MGQNIMGVELNLDQEYIKGAVEDIVKAGIVSALEQYSAGSADWSELEYAFVDGWAKCYEATH
jgi:hypothetical protein